ncbi:hypothetical protein [Paenibacillus lautus]|nr:hypothetical protein [Paenibacillus lautus]
MLDKNILYLCSGFEYNERIAKSEITTGASDPSERLRALDLGWYSRVNRT